MRALKTILIILLSVVVLILILGYLVGPRVTVVERSTHIDADPDILWPKVSDLRAMFDWSPWKDMEKGQRSTWEGEDGAVGSIHKWEGDTVGVGTQEITALEPKRRAEMELRFIKPWEAVSKVELELGPNEEGTEVTWRMTQENGFMGRLMGVFMDMDKMVGPDFERGLEKLKTVAEAEQTEREAELNAKTFRGYTIETVDIPEKVYIGKRAMVKWSDMQRHFGETIAAAGSAIGMAQLEMTGSPTNVYFLWDTKNQRTDFMPAFPVNAPATVKLSGLHTHVVPASKALELQVTGGYGQLGEAHTAIDEMLTARELTHFGNVIEEYLVAAPAEPDSNKWVTVIHYQIR